MVSSLRYARRCLRVISHDCPSYTLNYSTMVHLVPRQAYRLVGKRLFSVEPPVSQRNHVVPARTVSQRPAYFSLIRVKVSPVPGLYKCARKSPEIKISLLSTGGAIFSPSSGVLRRSLSSFLYFSRVFYSTLTVSRAFRVQWRALEFVESSGARSAL